MAQRIRAGILPSLQGPNSRIQVHRTARVEDVFSNSEEGIFAHISSEGLASNSDANCPSETRGKALAMIHISRTRPVVLKSDSDTESNILREYADFWKIPYELNSSTKGAAIFATGNATASDASRDSPLVISPNGMKEAGRIARSYGLGISVRNSLSSLPVGPGTNVSVRTDVCEFSGPDAEPLLKSGNTQVLTKVRGERVYLLSLNLVGEFSKRVYDGFKESPSCKFRLATRLHSPTQRFLGS